MDSNLGFLILNSYSLIIIIIVCAVFYSKKRQNQVEDRTYSKFLIVNFLMTFSGLMLGILVSPDMGVNQIIIALANKVYLIAILLWITILTFYTFYVSVVKKGSSKKPEKIFTIATIVNILMILFLPLTVSISKDGAVSGGFAILYTYLFVAIGFFMQLGLILLDHRNMRNRKYIPIYMLVVFGILVLVVQIINPSLNYLINPALNLIGVIMYFTIENPDLQMVDELLKNRSLVESSMEDKSAFLFKVSQEIKRPLQNTMKLVDSLKNKKLTKTEMNDELLVVEENLNNLAFIVNDVINVSNMDVSKIKIVSSSYKTTNFFDNIRRLTKGKLNENVKLNYSFNKNTPEMLYGDYIKLKQALIAILNNSVKYTENGYIDFEIDSITRYDLCRMIINIRDTGIGMNLNQINEILSDEKDLDKDDFAKIDTLDVDLKIAIKLIKMMGGSVNIKSNDNIGTSISIVVDQKVVRSKDDRADILKNYDVDVLGNKRVLIVDNDSNEIKKIVNYFAKNDVSSSFSIYGIEAVDRINAHEKYSLILLDDEMTPDSGLATLQKLQKIKKFNIPVIVMLDKEKEFIKEHYLTDGFADYLLKDKFDKELDRILNKHL